MLCWPSGRIRFPSCYRGSRAHAAPPKRRAGAGSGKEEIAAPSPRMAFPTDSTERPRRYSDGDKAYGAEARGRAALRRARLPRDLDRRPRRGARRAKGHFYAHIESKQDLLYDTMREGADAFHAVLDEIPEMLPSVEKIRLALRGHLRVVAEQLDVATVFVQEWRYLRASAGTRSSPSAAATRSGFAPSSAKGASSASSAPTWTTAPPPCSRSRPPTGRHLASAGTGHRRAGGPVFRVAGRRHARLLDAGIGSLRFDSVFFCNFGT